MITRVTFSLIVEVKSMHFHFLLLGKYNEVGILLLLFHILVGSMWETFMPENKIKSFHFVSTLISCIFVLMIT